LATLQLYNSFAFPTLFFAIITKTYIEAQENIFMFWMEFDDSGKKDQLLELGNNQLPGLLSPITDNVGNSSII
jgi:hypothetical protein